jgi:prepilin-type N-terminal cleavage/methylation domain-containing protein
VNRNTEVTTGSRHQLRGFSLLEIAIVLAILGFVLTIGLKSTGAYLSAERRQTTVARLAGIDAALVNYVAVQRRLPCAADGALQPGDVDLGLERRAANGTCLAVAGVPIMNRGVVPWVTLGISETEALDGWNNRITYRTVSAVVALVGAVPPQTNNGFTSDQALDMTNCDTAGAAGTPTVLRALGPSLQPVNTCVANGAPPGCSNENLGLCTPPLNFVNNRGLVVRDGFAAPVVPSGVQIMIPANATGAAYVLISHGENRGGAYSSGGVIQTGSPVNSALENINNNNQVVQGFYMDAPQVDAAGDNHFDDIVVRPTLMSVITRAGLGPRAH